MARVILMAIGAILMAAVVLAIGLVLLLSSPQTVGLLDESVARVTLTAVEEQVVVFRRTVDSADRLATRAFSLEQDNSERATELIATATQSAADSQATLDANATAITATAAQAAATLESAASATVAAFAQTQSANIDEAYGNIVARATLEYEEAVLYLTATAGANQLAGTQRALVAQSTNAARGAAATTNALQNTSVALQGAQFAFAQRRTQTAADAQATTTQAAQVSAAEATRAAEAFSGTQQAFAAESTRVERDYRGTQAALAADATALAADSTPDSPAAGGEIRNPPTRTGQPDTRENVIRGTAESLWSLSAPTDWSLNADGTVSARRDGAYLLSENAVRGDYTLEAAITTSDSDGAVYLLLSLPDGDTVDSGYAIRLNHAQSGMYRASLLRFDATAFRSGDLAEDSSTTLSDVGVRADGRRFRLQVHANGSSIHLLINGTSAMQATLDSALPSGFVGIQTPVNTRVGRIALTS